MAYLVRYDTESGDDGTIGIFDEAPDTWELQLALIEEYIPEEIVDGQSYAAITYEEIDYPELMKLPAPSTSDVESL